MRTARTVPRGCIFSPCQPAWLGGPVVVVVTASTAGRRRIANRRCSPLLRSYARLLRELIMAYADLGDDRGNARGQKLLALLADELRPSLQQPMQLPVPRDPRLIELCAMLEADPSDSRSLEALGRRVGASARTLTRLFREDMAMTFPQWRTQLRLYHALRLLAEGHAVKSVARRCGFANSSSFISVFRRSLGFSPGAYSAGLSSNTDGPPLEEKSSAV